MVRGRPSGLQAAPHRLRRRPCGPAWTPETSAAPGRQASRARPPACPLPAHGTLLAPAAYGEHGKGHLPALLQGPVEPKDVGVASMSYPRSRRGRRGGIDSHGNVAGTQEHQGAQPGPAPPSQGPLRLGWPAGAGHHAPTAHRASRGDPSPGPIPDHETAGAAIPGIAVPERFLGSARFLVRAGMRRWGRGAQARGGAGARAVKGRTCGEGARVP